MSHPVDDMVKGCPDAPHRAILWIRAEVHEVTKHGECSGSVKYRVEEFPLYVDGLDRNLCVRKLNELLAEVKEKCPSK